MSRLEELREALGGVHPGAVNKVKDHMEKYVVAFIRQAPFAVLASSDAEGNCDASPKGGEPGFIKVVDDRTLLIPDIGGNYLFQSYGNFESNPKVGLVFMIPGIDVTARVNGRISVIESDEVADRGVTPALKMTDKNSEVRQGILLSVDEAYFHCPRSFQFADLWNSEVIASNASKSLKDILNSD